MRTSSHLVSCLAASALVLLASCNSRDEFFKLGLERNPSPPWTDCSLDAYRRAPELVHTLREHEGVVMAMSVDRNGRYLASGGRDGKVIVRNLDSASRVLSYSHASMVTSVALGARLVMSGDSTGNVQVWDLDKGTRLATANAGRSIGAVAIGPGDRHAAAGVNYDNRVLVWALPSFELRWSAAARFFEFNLLSFGEASDTVHARFGLGENRVWRVGDGKLLRAFPDSHYGEITYASIDHRGRILATASDRQSVVHLWDTLSGQRVKSVDVTFEGGPFNPHVALDARGCVLATAALDETIRIWHTSSGERLTEFRNEREMHALAMSDQFLAGGDYDGVVKVWRFGALRPSAKP